MKRQRCENYKENTKCWTIYQIYQGVIFFTLNKTVKILGMSLRLKKVCQVYNTYPITELKLYWLIQWHLCVYTGVKVWSISYLLLSVIIKKCHKLIKVIVSKLSKKSLYGYSILPLMMQEKQVLGAWTVMQNSVLRSWDGNVNLKSALGSIFFFFQ